MNAHGTWPHAFINGFWTGHMTSFWQRMQRHVHENRDWAQNTWWMPRDADVKRVNWDNCHIENWDYQWFLDPNHRAPQWLDLTPAYRQWWIWSMLPTDSELQFYLAWINYEEGEYGTKIRQLQGWINEWNKLSQRSKMGFFDPVLPTAYVHERKMQVGANIDMSTPNPFKVSAYAIDTAMPSGHEEQLEEEDQDQDIPDPTRNVFYPLGYNRNWLFRDKLSYTDTNTVAYRFVSTHPTVWYRTLTRPDWVKFYKNEQSAELSPRNRQMTQVPGWVRDKETPPR